MLGDPESPLVFDEVRLPGIKIPPKLGPFDLRLQPQDGTLKIARAAFEGRFDFGISSLLNFELHSPGSRLMQPDIVRGDIGFPSVHLVNARGCVYRFARGNLKDFFDIRRPDQPQRVSLPLSAFVWDRDLVQNVPPEGNFFASGIVRLYFDFLRHPDQAIDIRLSRLSTSEASEATALDIRDVLIFERAGQSRLLPKFSTESATLSLGMSPSNTGLALGCVGCRLTLRLLEPDSEGEGAVLEETTLELRQEAVWHGLRLPRTGHYRLEGWVERPDGSLLASSTWPICRVLPAPPLPAKEGVQLAPTARRILGISDEFEYERIALAGGLWDRLVVSLTTLMEDPAAKSGLRFAAGTKPLFALPAPRGARRVLAVFGMPRWLSRRPDRPDYYRYGPSDWDRWARLVEWLAPQAAVAGVTHWEVWNESTALGHWADDMETLVKLHKVTRAALDRAAPGMTVLGGCTHSWTWDFLERFLEAGGAEHCDGLALHGYTYQPEEYLDLFDRLDGLMARYAADRPDFAAYVTEVGFRHPAFSLEAQAEYLTLFTLEAAARGRIEAMLWFRFTNPRPEITSGYRQNSSTGYAMIGHNDSYCRPAYVAYRGLAALLGRCDRVEASGSPETRRFTLLNAEKTIAIVTRATAAPVLESGWRRPFGDLLPGFVVERPDADRSNL